MMAVLGLSAAGASAEIVDGVRQQPLPVKSALTYGEAMYLFNQGAKQFFLGANDWNTRASVGEKGYQVTITDNGDGSFLFQDRVETQNNEIKCVFADPWVADGETLPAGNVWVDNSTAPNRFWSLTNTGDDIYRFSVSSVNPDCNDANTVLGLKKSEPTNTRLYWNLAPEDAIADWYFVTIENYEAYLTVYANFVLAQSLKSVIDEAKAAGIDVAAEEKVYLDESSSTDAINEAIASVKQKISSAEEGKVTADNPVDKTSMIVNPSYDSNNNTGWSGDAPAFQSYTDAEFYQKKFNTYQNITGAPKGVYKLSVQAFYRSGWSGNAYTNYKNMTQYDAKMYAEAGGDRVTADIVNPFSQALTEAKGMNESSVVGDDGVTYWIPNNMETAEAYFMDGLYYNNVFFATEDGDMTIGLYKDNSDTPAGNWVLYDNWGLTYYGNGADAYSMWLAEAKKAAKDYSGLSDDVLVTKGMIDAYNEAIAGLTIANSKADVLAAVNTINEEVAKVDANIAAWKAYQDLLAKASIIANDDEIGGQDKEDLADYIDLDSEDIIGDLALSTEEIIAETEKVNAMYEAAIKNGIKEGSDVTEKYLVNADFETDNLGWIVEKASGGNVTYGGTSTNKCFEAWNNAKFDIYQEVKDAPIGVYEISVQGFYRYGRGATAYEAYQNGIASTDAVSVYVNNSNAHFKNVFDEPVANGELYTGGTYIDPNEEYWYPNDMTTGSEAFAADMYKATSFGVVAKAGDVLRIGVKGNTSQLGDSWAIWDNFHMVFQGTKAEVVKPLLEKVIATLQETLAKGNVAGKSVIADANDALAAGNAAVGGTDGKAMFEALSNILAANSAIEESVALFTTLNEKNADLYAAWMASVATEQVKADAAALYDEIGKAITAGTLENEDVDAYLAKIEKTIVLLGIPAEASTASDANPVDMTSLIKTPSFEKDGSNSIEGWNADGYNFGNDDTQKSALLVEFYNKTFDLNQTIVGLPNGTYKVTVNAFYRFGGTADDWAKYNEDKNTAGNAFMYATTGGKSINVPVALLASGACEDNGFSGTSNITDTDLYVPNDMVSANAYFSELGAYLNEIIVKVVDNELTIGIKQEDKVSNDWVILDNWTLTYYGENSSKEETSKIDGVEVSEPAKVEIFNVNGMKTKGFSKGVNIVKMTSKDGSVRFSKVNVK
ncbi:MAG: hypothetical protein ACI3YT_06505 [Prevotella sp.]